MLGDGLVHVCTCRAGVQGGAHMRSGHGLGTGAAVVNVASPYVWLVVGSMGRLSDVPASGQVQGQRDLTQPGSRRGGWGSWGSCSWWSTNLYKPHRKYGLYNLSVNMKETTLLRDYSTGVQQFLCVQVYGCSPCVDGGSPFGGQWRIEVSCWETDLNAQMSGQVRI